MKKIIIIVFLILCLVSCEKKGCNNDIFEFGHSGVLTFYVDENPLDKLKDIKVKITSKGKENVLSLDNQSFKVNKFKFDEIGDYVAEVIYNNKSYLLKYKVEIRKWNQKVDTSWYQENENIYTIKNANQLAGLASLVNEGNDFSGKTVTLACDIDLANLPWIPIGTNGTGKQVEYNKYFSGTFDGNNKTIYNLYTKALHNAVGEHLDESTSYYHFGLFGYVKNAIIKNVKINNVNILNGMTNGYVRSMQGTGALVGYASGDVILENNKVLGNISIKGEYKVGGLIGSCSGSSIVIKDVSVRGGSNSFIGGSDSEFKDTNNFGGILGFSASGNTKFENIISDIDVDGYTCGGIIGNATEGSMTISNACIYGDISNKEGSVVGGICGGRFINMTLSHCYIFGSVSSKDKTYADICVSKYGDTGVVISCNEVYFNSDNFKEDVNNTLSISGLSLEDLKNKLPDILK